jgi:hypothetical protein
MRYSISYYDFSIGGRRDTTQRQLGRYWACRARETVKLMGNDEGMDEEYKEEEEVSFEGFEVQYANEPKANDPVSLRDRNSLTMVELKIELKNCGLKTYGKKTKLVSLLQAYDAEQFGAILEGEEDSKAAVASR